MNYYTQIKDTLVKNEIYKKTKDYSKNKSDLNSYYEVGKLLIKAQGGEERAKYGNKLIKEYSEKLTNELGKGYSVTNLKNMRQFYLRFKKGRTVCDQLSWSHYRYLLPIKKDDIFDYYIYISTKQNLSVSELRKRIKSKEYERIGYKEELEKPRVNTLIKEPILIKTTQFEAQYTGQVKKYINYVDENIKETFNDKTVGVIICKEVNGYVLKYCTDNRIFTTTYELI